MLFWKIIGRRNLRKLETNTESVVEGLKNYWPLWISGPRLLTLQHSCESCPCDGYRSCRGPFCASQRQNFLVQWSLGHRSMALNWHDTTRKYKKLKNKRFQQNFEQNGASVKTAWLTKNTKVRKRTFKIIDRRKPVYVVPEQKQRKSNLQPDSNKTKTKILTCSGFS